jgi:hypothetical protein
LKCIANGKTKPSSARKWRPAIAAQGTGGIKTNHAKWPKELGHENAMLNRMVAEARVDMSGLFIVLIRALMR